MGLAPYGKVQENWLSHFYDFYECINNGLTYQKVLKKLGSDGSYETIDRLKRRVKVRKKKLKISFGK